MNKVQAYLRFLYSLGISERYEWEIALRRTSERKLYEGNGDGFYVIKNSWRYWSADPFVFKYKGSNYLFAELFDRIEGKGVLGVAKIVNGRATHFKEFMRKPYHLSYPCVWEEGGKIYLMPETYQDSKVHIYKAVKFPYKWELFKTIANDLSVCDTTPVTVNGRKRFYTTKVPENGLWEITDCNDLKEIAIDNGKVRGAGHFIILKDDIIRPSQNCSETYGGNLIFNHVDSFEPYKEHVLFQVFSDKCPNSIEKDIVIKISNSADSPYYGIHTYNLNEDYEVIDLKYRNRFNIVVFVKNFRNYIRFKMR